MTAIIVGSTALKKFNLNRREPSDIDYWLSSDEPIPEKTDSNVFPTEILSLVPTMNGYATPDAIYTIKCSHLVYDIFFDKHKLDVLYLKAKGCKLIPELYEALIHYWPKIHGSKDFLSLSGDREDFFQMY